MTEEISPYAQSLSPPERLLMGPGPSCVHPRVYRALSTGLVGHLDPEFLKLMDRLQERLRVVFNTTNLLTISVSGTGSSGMEAVFANLIEPGDAALVGVNGVFGARMADVVERVGGELFRVERPWGEVFAPEEIEQALDRDPKISLVAVVHAETSTGARQPLEEIGRICRARDKLFVVDAVTSLGGIELRVDDWNIDACYSGTQKCLSCPPGLAPVTFGDRAVEKIHKRRSKVVSWYFDMNLIDRYWTEGNRAYHHTAPISMNYALHEALGVLLERGLEESYARHRLNSRALVAGLEAIGLRMFIEDESRRLPMLNSVRLMDRVPDGDVRARLLHDYNIEIGGGLGSLAGEIWRIGLMGESSRREHVLLFLGALESTLHQLAVVERVGSAVEAAGSVYAASRG